ncbi:hypothetical protein D3C77_142920 [compost metagenome]
MVRREIRRLDVVLAGQIDRLGEAGLQLVETLGIQLQQIQIAAQLAVALLHPDQGFVQHAEHVAKAAIHAGQGLGPVHRHLQQAGYGGLLVVIEQVEAIAALLHQLGAVGEALVLLFDGLKLPGLQGELIQLLHLILDELATGLPLLLLGLEAVELVLQLAPQLIVLAHLIEQQVVTGIAIQQGELIVGFEQQLMRVLAVNVDQQLTQALELHQGDGDAVDVAARAPLGGEYPPHYALTIVLQLVGGEPGAGGRVAVQQETGTDFRLVAARPHHAGFGPLAEAEAEGVDGNGFACPRLPCDAGHAGLQIEFEKLDDGEVVDGQLGQHGLILYGSTLLCMHPVYTGLIYSKVCGAGFFAGQGDEEPCEGLHRERHRAVMASHG